ncbi:hypothetical protein [Bradyrhizobium sp. B120]|uniref:hypothetical protein n=1 Tax=Bradyrhizobium sp. B120 TaxID=3410088 RepID=UPI003B9861BF
MIDVMELRTDPTSAAPAGGWIEISVLAWRDRAEAGISVPARYDHLFARTDDEVLSHTPVMRSGRVGNRTPQDHKRQRQDQGNTHGDHSVSPNK